MADETMRMPLPDEAICTACGREKHEHDLPLRTGACFAFTVLPAVPPTSPFPAEVVERAEDALVHVGGASFMAPVALSIIADYLRSEEARELIMQALWEELRETTHGECGRAADAVIAALLGEKEQG